MSIVNPNTKVNPREARGREIAANKTISRNGTGGWLVPSELGQGVYKVVLDGDKPRCECPDHRTRNVVCKHIFAAQIVVTSETDSKGKTTVTKSVKVTYRQEWPAY